MRRLVIGLVVAGALGAAGLAQQPAPVRADPTISGPQQQQQPVFRAGANIVRLDVSVLDKQRRPVRGLTADDFIVLENGKPQKVLTVVPVDIEPAPASVAGWSVEAGRDLFTNAVQDRRLLVLVMDTATEGNLFEAKTAREVGHLLVDAMGPSDLMAVIYSGDNRRAQDFTSDRTLLRDAIDHTGMWANTLVASDLAISSPGQGAQPSAVAPSPGGTLCDGFTRSATVLKYLAESLRDVPDRRKAIMFVSAGVTFNPLALTPGGRDPGGCQALLKYRLDEAFQQLQLANVNVYPVSVAGLRPRVPGVAVQGNIAAGPDLATDYLLMLAANTGGRATVNNNRPSRDAVARIMTENGSYYILGYELPVRERQGENWRRVEVRVKRPDVEVRARSKFFEEAVAKEPVTTSPLRRAIAGLLPNRGLPLELSIAPFASADRPGEALVAITVGMMDVDAAPGSTVNLAMLAAAFDSEGKEIAATQSAGTVTYRKAATGPARFELQSNLVLKPGKYQLRVGVHHGRSDDIGSVYATVDIPRFTSEALAFSGAMFTVTPPLPSSISDDVVKTLPAAPTAQRTFRGSDEVAAFMRVYQADKTTPRPVQMQVNIVDAKNVRVVDRVVDLPASAFVNGEADFRFPLPATLRPGNYLLSFEATNVGLLRTLRFRIQ